MADMTKRPAEWIDQAPIRVRATRELPATPEQVWAVIADHVHWPEWFPGLKHVVVTGGDGEGVGATRSVTLQGGLRADEEFVEWEPGHRFGFTVVAFRPPLFRSLNELVTIDDLDAGRVRVTYQQALDPRGWAAPIVKALAAKRMPAALEAGLAGLEQRVGSST